MSYLDCATGPTALGCAATGAGVLGGGGAARAAGAGAGGAARAAGAGALAICLTKETK